MHFFFFFFFKEGIVVVFLHEPLSSCCMKLHINCSKFGNRRACQTKCNQTVRKRKAQWKSEKDWLRVVSVNSLSSDLVLFFCFRTAPNSRTDKSIDPSFLFELLEKFSVRCFELSCKTDRCQRSRKCRNYCEFKEVFCLLFPHSV